MASIVIVTKDRKEDLRRALQSAVAQTVAPEIIVVDDGSTDGTAAMVASEFPSVQLHNSKFSKGCVVQRNRAAQLTSSEILFSMDDDAEFSTPRVVEQTLAEFTPSQICAVAIPFVNVNATREVQQKAPDQEKIWVTDRYIGAAYAVHRDVFLRLGGYCEDFFHQGEEEDLCIRMLNAGYLVRLGRADPVHHFESPKRDLSRMDFYGCRNLILFAWRNIPMPYLLRNIVTATINCVRWTFKPKRLATRLHGLIRGYKDCLSMKRAPVSGATYRAWRHLRKNGPLPMESLQLNCRR